jgi:NAD(P)-dependent dehydrogenase (short-subunit alcohol dehydrogenase family)
LEIANRPTQPLEIELMKMAIVTGAARGIGLATARLFVDQGYQVAMVDRDEDALDAAAASLAGSTAFVCDVSDPAAVDEMVAAVLAVSGRIDCLVNNAGVADFCPIEDTSFARWRTVMATNLDGVYLCSRAALAALKAKPWQHCQYCFDFRIARINIARCLWHVKGWCDPSNPAICRLKWVNLAFG